MTTIVLSPTGTASFPDGGGHWWVYLQYALTLRDLGCRVIWLERCTETAKLDLARDIRSQFGFDDDVLLYREEDASGGGTSSTSEIEWLNVAAAEAHRTLGSASLLLNFDYSMPAALVELVACSALVDIDPGLLQTWWSRGHITPADHDLWFTTGETVGTSDALIDDCGVEWLNIRPSVHLPSWRVATGPDSGRFTSVTSWCGNEWLNDEHGKVMENNKRVAFLPYWQLPHLSSSELELAAYFGKPQATSSELDRVTPATVGGDADDVQKLLEGGWLLRRSHHVAGNPLSYRSYIRESRGEFGCAKPSCRLLQNAWISDRTLCYLASGRPAIVEHTGPSSILDNSDGLLRFSNVDEAVEGLARVERDYAHHRAAARELAEAHFSAHAVLTDVLNTALHPGKRGE